MKTETKEKVAFMAASLFDLAEMTESDLPSVVEVLLLYLKTGKSQVMEKAGHEMWTMLQFPHE